MEVSAAESPQTGDIGPVVVCRDAGAGGYEAFPDVCRLKDGRLMVVFYAGYGHVALPNDRLPKGGRICRSYSSDEGRTWSAAEVLYDGPEDDRDPSIAQLRSGRLICTFFSLHKAPPPGPGYAGLGSWMVTSEDAGKTWSPPVRISKDHYCSAPVRELSDGRCVLGLYSETPAKATGAVIYSDDGGLHWSSEVEIDNSGMRFDAETDLIELSDRRLYAALRADGGRPMGWSVSHDRGAHWSPAQTLPFPGHCPYFLRTQNGIILLAHRVPNTSLHYSTDECRSWSGPVAIDSVTGAYPSMVNLRDGSVLVVYYEEGEGSNIRARRFKASAQGIEWLSLR